MRLVTHNMKPLTVLQITDCHLGSQPGAKLLGLDTDKSLYDVLQALDCDAYKPDLIVATGDISGDGGAASYVRFLSIIDDFYPSVPLAWLPGNHDDPAAMIPVAGHPIELQHKVRGWNMILLDSRIPGETGGRLNDAELARLEAELAANSGLPTLIFLHHQPVPVGSAWVDQYVLENADAFFAITDRFDTIKAISWGHVHQEFNAIRKGVRLMATPSTCIQFEPNRDEFTVSRDQPAYRTYQLHIDGSFTTEVVRVDSEGQHIDFASNGY